MFLMIFSGWKKTITAPENPAPPFTYKLTDYYAACQGNKIMYLHASDTAGIYQVDLDGKNRRLILRSQVELTFNWTANLLVFSDGTVYKMNMDNQTVTALTDSNTTFYFPVIGPKDQKILVVQPYQPDAGIWQMDSDGKNLHKMVADAKFPDYTADGQKIVYLKLPKKIIVADANGQQLKEIAGPGMEIHSVKISADGAKIIFSSQAEGETPQIWTVNADGSNMRQLTKSGGDFPEWTGDGRIVFTNTATGYLNMMDADGNGITAITK
jgi:Tol biopolymer transport system component